MRVAMYYNNRDVRLEEMAIPRVGSGELLVRVEACGICGSDVMEWYRIKKAPCVLGHEPTGEIVEVGSNVDTDKYKKGDRVFVTHHVPCNKCRYCLNGYPTVCDTLRTTYFDPGGFAEYVRVPQINVDRGVYILPEEMSFEEGTFIEPLGCVVRGQRIANVEEGQSVLVIGSGITGLLHIQLARFKGARPIIATDINEFRLKAAKRFGADAVINAKVEADEDVPRRVAGFNENRLADQVIICTGTVSAINQGIQSVDRGGTVLFFAPTPPATKIQIPLWHIWHNQISFASSYAAVTEDLKEAIEMILTRRVNVKEMITHRLSLAETGLGFQLVANAQRSIKVIIEPQR
jgi:L-iditol 2-dehydrogenase